MSRAAAAATRGGGRHRRAGRSPPAGAGPGQARRAAYGAGHAAPHARRPTLAGARRSAPIPGLLSR